MRDVDYEVVITTSGAPAMYDRTAGEVMHPVAGPLAEAEQLYVLPARLTERLSEGGEPLVLLDVGLGAGSNGVAAWNASARLAESARKLVLVSFDAPSRALRLRSAAAGSRRHRPEARRKRGSARAGTEARARSWS